MFLDIKPSLFTGLGLTLTKTSLGVEASGLVRLTPQSLARWHILPWPGATAGVWGEKAGATRQETGMQVNYKGEAQRRGHTPGAGQL